MSFCKSLPAFCVKSLFLMNITAILHLLIDDRCLTLFKFYTIYITFSRALVQISYGDIAYGGILNYTEAVECKSAQELRIVIRFAIKFAKKRWPKAVPLNTQGKILTNYEAKNCSILELVYTHDGTKPHMFVMDDPTHFGKVVHSPLYWGHTYRFHVSWPSYPEIHSFLVTEYYGDLYVYQHTFHSPLTVKEQSGPLSDLSPTRNEKIAIHNTVDTLLRGSCLSKQTSTYFMHESFQLCPAAAEYEAFMCSGKDKINSLDNEIFSPATQKPLHGYHEQASVKYSAFQNDNHHTQSVLRFRDAVVNSQLFQNISIDFRILTFNIWNTNSVIEDNTRATRYIERIKNLAKVCNTTDADVIAFQEVRFEDGRGGRMGPNQVQHLASLLPQYQLVYEPAQIQEHGIPRRIEEGVAIFSRFPIVRHHVTHLTRDREDIADTHQRILLDVLIDVPVLGHIHVLNTHLSLSHVARQRSVVEIWSRVRPMTSPVFLMGDFNAEAHNDEVRFLSGLTSLHGVTTRGFRDLWLQHHGSKHPGFTFSTLDAQLTKRIDLIFMKEHPAVVCTGVERVDDAQRKEKAASDHLGLLASFKGFGLKAYG